MAFTVDEFRDIVRIIEQHPEWRAELRRLVLTDELLSLPGLVRELVEAQRRTEERLGVLEERMAALAEAQKRTEERMGVLGERMAALAEAQKRTEERVDALAKAQEETSRHLEELATNLLHVETRLSDMGKDVGDLKGMVLEIRYQERAPAYFLRLIKRAHVLSVEEFHHFLEPAVEKGQLSDEEFADLSWADVVVRGQGRKEAAEVFLVVEVSWGIGPSDVERASRRAGLLAKTGVKAVPVVAGKSINADALERARSMQVHWVLDGQHSEPEIVPS